MKIGITGSHGVGKTTLAKVASTRLRLPLIPEIVRKVTEEGFAVLTEDSETNVNSQLAMFGYQMVEEQRLDSFISDRILLDYYIYTRELVEQSLPYVFLESMKQLTYDYCAYEYDFIFYIPIEFSLDGDGFRAVDIEQQKKMDDRISLALGEISKDYGTKIFTVEGSVEDRLEGILNKIKEE